MVYAQEVRRYKKKEEIDRKTLRSDQGQWYATKLPEAETVIGPPHP